MACFLLFGAFLDEFSAFSGRPFHVVDIAIPEAQPPPSPPPWPPNMHTPPPRLGRGALSTCVCFVAPLHEPCDTAQVLIGGLIGTMMIYWFTGLAIAGTPY